MRVRLFEPNSGEVLMKVINYTLTSESRTEMYIRNFRSNVIFQNYVTDELDFNVSLIVSNNISMFNWGGMYMGEIYQHARDLGILKYVYKI